MKKKINNQKFSNKILPDIKQLKRKLIDQCPCNIIPLSAMLTQHCSSIESMSCICWDPYVFSLFLVLFQVLSDLFPCSAPFHVVSEIWNVSCVLRHKDTNLSSQLTLSPCSPIIMNSLIYYKLNHSKLAY